jgi:hypothetical protein
MMQSALRYGIVAMARADRRLAEATLQSLARLSDAPDAMAFIVPAVRKHQFADVASGPGAVPLRVVTSESDDALPLSDGFRAMAQTADVILFVPEGVVLAPDYLTRIRKSAERWQDMVGAIDVVDGVVDHEGFTGSFAESAPAWSASAWLRSWRPKTLAAHVLWVRVEACGGIKFMPFPQSCEYLAFSFLLDQLHNRGRIRVASSGAAVRVRAAPERRSGFTAGRELYGALSRIGEWRSSSDMGFADRARYLDPRSEKIALFGEQMLRYARSAATRAHVGSFIRGMWAARREATASRDRIRDDIRSLR